MSLFNKHQNQVYIESRKIIYSKQMAEIRNSTRKYFGIILWVRFSLENMFSY